MSTPTPSASPGIAPPEDGLPGEAVDPVNTLREVDGAELSDLGAALRQSVERLEHDSALTPDELATQRRVLSFVLREARRRTATGWPDPAAHLQAASYWADLFTLHTPAGAKRVLLTGLRPVHTELLRPQRAFNLELVRLLSVLASGSASPDGGMSAAFALSRLQELADNTQWKVNSHRSGWTKAVVEGAKRGLLQAASPLIRVALEQQRAWNEAAVVALKLAAERKRPLSQAHRHLGTLQRLAHLPTHEALAPLARLSYPLWSELFRHQSSFNLEIERALAAHFGLPVPAEDGRTDAYCSWAAEKEASELAESTAALPRCRARPLLTIVTPTYETPEPLLRACIDSVRAQTYGHWELCVADDGSKSPAVRRILDEYVRLDPRIRVAYMPQNRGIALATNEAISRATGDFVCFLDHDDVLAPHALAEVVRHLDGAPATDVLYTDEDRLDMQGRRTLPFFKPSWSPDLLRACNYICHFLTVRRELLESVGRVRPGFDGSQDYDLILRLSERTDRIAHIPKLLYHWRATPQSTAQDVSNKPTASGAGIRALQDHLARMQEPGVVDAPVPTHYRVRYTLAGSPLVSVVITGNDVGAAERTARSVLEKTRYPRFEVLIVGPSGGGGDIRRVPWSGPARRGAMANEGAKAARGEFLVFLHDDVELVDERWMEELLGHAQRSKVGAVSPKLAFSDGHVQHVGWVRVPTGELKSPFAHMIDGTTWTTQGNLNWTRNFAALSDACLMISRAKFEGAGGFDAAAEHLPELGLFDRLHKQGLRAVYTPHTRLVHHDLHPHAPVVEAVLSGDLSADPYFNPNLSGVWLNGALPARSLQVTPPRPRVVATR